MRANTARTTGTTSQTVTQNNNSGAVSPASSSSSQTLRLQGHQNGDNDSNTRPRRTVRWTDDVVDNEHMNKKKTKICCIFHPQRQFGESSDESSSSDSDGDSDSGASDSESDDCDHHGHHSNPQSHGRENGAHNGNSARLPSPNAYERQPKYKTKKKSSTMTVEQ